mmetsp:Transcript_21109/g.52343  ORF Transcript_21109/g.52343 Transcript_21109/m.52343 type:complete len:669 (+) Transcript_21109:186-2192(+)
MPPIPFNSLLVSVFAPLKIIVDNMTKIDVENGKDKDAARKGKQASTNLSSKIGGNVEPIPRKKPSRMVRILCIVVAAVMLILCITALVFVLRIFVFSREDIPSISVIEEDIAASMVVMEVTQRKLTPLEINEPDEGDVLAKARSKSSFEESKSFDGNRRRRLDEIVDWQSACEPCEYYESITNWDVPELRSRLESNVRVLDYSDKNDPVGDTWKALADVDRVDSNSEIHLIYTNRTISSSKNQSGTSESMDRWNREHLWPKARGVGYDKQDPKHNDIHHLFPSDVNTNSNARGNRYFDVCDDEDDCRKWEITINGTTIEYDGIRYEASNTGKFQPPEKARGIVARAVMYMDLRYPELELTDNPDPNQENQMGKLATLLQWHEEYPPKPSEVQRNDRVCSKWQGNRNPFVDFPDLAKIIYGDSTIHNVDKDRFLNCGKEGTIHDNDPSPGDVMIVGVHSDNPDAVALVALRDLPKGWVIRITDNAYVNTSFKSNEGTLSLSLSNIIPAGTVFGYGGGMLYGSAWHAMSQDQNFDLSVSGDTIAVCATTERNPDICTVLSAVSVAGDKFGDFPESVADFSVALGSLDNYVYTGETNGEKESLQKYLINNDYWMGSNGKTGIPEFKDRFEIAESFVIDPIEASIDSTVDSVSFAKDPESVWWIPDWLAGMV